MALQRRIDPVQHGADSVWGLPPRGLQGHRAAEPPPLGLGGQGGQFLQQDLPQRRGQSAVHRHRVHHPLQLCQGEGLPCGVPPRPPPVGHREAVLVHGGQIPVDAFALHRDPSLGQALDDLLGGKGMVLVALLIEQADQGQGAVSLVGMGFPHGSSLLWVSGSIIEQMF